MAVKLPEVTDEVRVRIHTECAREAVMDDAELTISRWEAMAAHETIDEARAEWQGMADRLRGLLDS